MTSGTDRPATRPIPHLTPAPLDPLTLGSTVVVAPHPDDESLGCGGTIARLRQANIPVQVLVVSDGSMSHPNSVAYPADRLRWVRQQEALNALALLGVSADAVTFMNQQDGRVLTPEQDGFSDTVLFVRELFSRLRPQTVLVPWQRDPHRDHRAVWQLVDAALTMTANPPRRLAYFVWLWELAQPADWPQPGEARAWQIDISDVLAVKKRAIAAHTSQVTRLIDDDPTGFYLSPELLTHFDRTEEIYFET